MPRSGDGDRLPLQVTDGTHPLGGEQLEAADVDPRQQDNRVPRVQAHDERPNEMHAEVRSRRRPVASESLDLPSVLTYCTSVNPSPCRSSSATYWGATQRPPLTCASLSFVVSGGGSAATDLGFRPRSPAVPASVSPPKTSAGSSRRSLVMHRYLLPTCWCIRLRQSSHRKTAAESPTPYSGIPGDRGHQDTGVYLSSCRALPSVVSPSHSTGAVPRLMNTRVIPIASTLILIT